MKSGRIITVTGYVSTPDPTPSSGPMCACPPGFEGTADPNITECATPQCGNAYPPAPTCYMLAGRDGNLYFGEMPGYPAGSGIQMNFTYVAAAA